MKTRIIVSMLMLCGVLLACSSLFAGEEYILVKIPFSFTVNEKTFPAGTYTIRQTDMMDLTAYTIRSQNGRLSESFITESAEKGKIAPNAQLYFDEVGRQYYLSQFFNPGEQLGRQLSKPKAESANQPHHQKIVEGSHVKKGKS